MILAGVCYNHAGIRIDAQFIQVDTPGGHLVLDHSVMVFHSRPLTSGLGGLERDQRTFFATAE